MSLGRLKEGLPFLVDWLPYPEDEVVTALYWEQATLRTVAERLGWRLPGGDLDAKKVERTCTTALNRIESLVAAMEDLGFVLGDEDADDE